MRQPPAFAEVCCRYLVDIEEVVAAEVRPELGTGGPDGRHGGAGPRCGGRRVATGPRPGAARVPAAPLPHCASAPSGSCSRRAQAPCPCSTAAWHPCPPLPGPHCPSNGARSGNKTFVCLEAQRGESTSSCSEGSQRARPALLRQRSLPGALLSPPAPFPAQHSATGVFRCCQSVPGGRC